MISSRGVQGNIQDSGEYGHYIEIIAQEENKTGTFEFFANYPLFRINLSLNEGVNQKNLPIPRLSVFIVVSQVRSENVVVDPGMKGFYNTETVLDQDNRKFVNSFSYAHNRGDFFGFFISYKVLSLGHDWVKYEPETFWIDVQFIEAEEELDFHLRDEPGDDPFISSFYSSLPLLLLCLGVVIYKRRI